MAVSPKLASTERPSQREQAGLTGAVSGQNTPEQSRGAHSQGSQLLSWVEGLPRLLSNKPVHLWSQLRSSTNVVSAKEKFVYEGSELVHTLVNIGPKESASPSPRGGESEKKDDYVEWPPLTYSEKSFKASFYNFSSQVTEKQPLPVICP